MQNEADQEQVESSALSAVLAQPKYLLAILLAILFLFLHRAEGARKDIDVDHTSPATAFTVMDSFSQPATHVFTGGKAQEPEHIQISTADKKPPYKFAAIQSADQRYDFAGQLLFGSKKLPRWGTFEHVKPGRISSTVLSAPSIENNLTGNLRSDLNREFVVIIDPGHGGSDPGAIGSNGVQEKDLTLDIAKRVALFLSETDNIKAVLTRPNDIGLSRKSRVARVRQSHADLVVSLHLNHLPQRDINLVETFFAGPRNIAESLEQQAAEKRASAGSTTARLVRTANKASFDMRFTQGSARLADIMQKRVFDAVNHANPQTNNAGVKQDTLYILTRSYTPGVLIEMSCLSNNKESQRLKDETYLDHLAAALADGIRDYVASPESANAENLGV